jgi:hypothetical protein
MTEQRGIGRADYNFRGDFDAAAALMKRSWASNKDQSLLYTPEFLTNLFTYPGMSTELAAAIYKEGQPVAFVAAFPRTVRLHGKLVRLATTTLLTVEPESQGKLYGAAVWSECTMRAKAAGFDGTLNFCLDRAPSNTLVEMCGRRLGYPTKKIFSTAFATRLLDACDAPDPAEASGSDIELFLEIAATVAAPPLARVWSGAEAEWQCRHRQGAICVRHESGPRRGLLTGYVMEVVGGGRCLLVEDLLWGSLEDAGRIELVQKMMRAGAAAGAQLAVAPRMRYTDEEPLLRSGMRKSRRLIHTWITLWHGGECGEEAGSQYIDIF